MNGSCASASTSAAPTPTRSWWTAGCRPRHHQGPHHAGAARRHPERHRGRRRLGRPLADHPGDAGHDPSRQRDHPAPRPGPRGHPAARRARLATRSSPGSAWPADLRAAIMGPTMIAHGGFEYDGREIAPLDPEEIKRFAARVRGQRARRSPSRAPSRPPTSTTSSGPRRSCARSWATRSPSRSPTRSARWACWSARTRPRSTRRCCRCPTRSSSGLAKALTDNGLDVTAYLTQNDGTLMGAEQAVKFPILTVGSGPTNSMRGACALAGLQDALVIDVGGTSYRRGHPGQRLPARESPRRSRWAACAPTSGCRTSSPSASAAARSCAATGDDVQVGPDSVGYRVVTEALVMGGAVPTLSDVSVKGGRLTGFGDAARLGGMSEATAAAALRWVDERIQTLCDRMKASPPGAAAHRRRRRLAPRGQRTCRASRRSSRPPTSRSPTRSARPSRRRPVRSTGSTATRS